MISFLLFLVYLCDGCFWAGLMYGDAARQPSLWDVVIVIAIWPVVVLVGLLCTAFTAGSWLSGKVK